MLGSLWHPIDKAGSATSFSSEDAFPNVNLSDKNPKLENEINVDATRWILTIYVQQNKIKKTDNDSDS